MPIRVEFYGIARQRAGCAAHDCEALPREATLADVLREVACRVPEFAQCLAGGRLQATLSANLDGERFVSDPATPIRDGQSLLILSADAGG